MKRITVLLLAFAALFTSCSYEPGISEAYSKYRFKDGITTITVPGWGLSLVSTFADLDESEKDIIDCIDKIKLVVIEDEDLNAHIDLHKDFYHKINKEGKYEELLVVRDGKETVTVFGNMKKSVIKEMVVLVGGSDNVMVYLKGDFKPEQFQSMKQSLLEDKNRNNNLLGLLQ